MQLIDIFLKRRICIHMFSYCERGRCLRIVCLTGTVEVERHKYMRMASAIEKTFTVTTEQVFKQLSSLMSLIVGVACHNTMT